MGNCIRCHHESQAHWGGEDWSPALMSEEEKSTEAVSKKVSMEVKIKITKKQLEKYLLISHDNHHLMLKEQGLSVHQALSQLISLSAHCEAVQHRSGWRPRLQTIPEVNQVGL